LKFFPRCGAEGTSFRQRFARHDKSATPDGVLLSFYRQLFIFINKKG